MYSKLPNNYTTDDDNHNYLTQEDYESDLRLVSEKLPGKLKRTKSKIRFVEDIVALYRYVLDSDVKWYRKAIVVAGLIYFITPIDTIPDMTPLIGYLDDLGVIAAILKYLGSEIKPYYRVDSSEIVDL